MALSLFNLLRFPLVVIPMVITSVIQVRRERDKEKVRPVLPLDQCLCEAYLFIS